MVGYTSEFHFSRKFKETVGTFSKQISEGNVKSKSLISDKKQKFFAYLCISGNGIL